MRNVISITSHDGGVFPAYACTPDSDLPAPGVIVIHDTFGLSDVTRKITDHLSQAGYFALCPDLFWRQAPGTHLDPARPSDREEARRLGAGFDLARGVEDVKTVLAFLRAQPTCTGKVGTVGFSLGGRLSYLMAARTDADCNVVYYGTGIETLLSEAGNIKAPLLMHLAEKDEYVPLAAQEQILSVLNGPRHMDVHVHPDVGHDFARPGGAAYDKPAAQRANYATADFLATHIAKRRT